MILLILIIVSVSITLVNCTYCEKCVHLNYCESVKYRVEKTRSEDGVDFCNEIENIVCCPDKEEVQTIAEKQCLKFPEIEGFCEKRMLIKGGSEPIPHEFPFMVLVEHTDPDGIVRQHCGGVLIDPQYVLTAAHCIKSNEMSVRLGAHNRTSGALVNVTAITHPNYTSTDPYADIALLKLYEKADITSKYIKPACLSSTNGSGNEDEPFLIAGWGFVRGRTSPNALLKGAVVEADGFKCQSKDMSFDIDKQICAGPKDGYGDACENDSGGPLFSGYSGRETCLFGVVGIVSVGGFCNAKWSYTRYTRVSFYREWIESEVWPEELSK